MTEQGPESGRRSRLETTAVAVVLGLVILVMLTLLLADDDRRLVDRPSGAASESTRMTTGNETGTNNGAGSTKATVSPETMESPGNADQPQAGETIETSNPTETLAAEDATMTEDVLAGLPEPDRQMLLNLDKTDDLLAAAWLEPGNFSIAERVEGRFTAVDADEVLALIKVAGQPHAGGLDLTVAAVYDRETLACRSQMIFPHDECRFAIYADAEGMGLLAFTGMTAVQDEITYVAKVVRPVVGSDWKQAWPEPDSPYVTGFNTQYRIALLPEDRMEVAEAEQAEDGAETDGAETDGEVSAWITRSVLAWSPDTRTMRDILPPTLGYFAQNSLNPDITVSPDGSTAMLAHPWGLDDASYVAFYDVGGKHLIKRVDLLSMGFQAIWAPNGRQLAVTIYGRIWGGFALLDLDSDRILAIPDDLTIATSFMEQGLESEAVMAEIRPDPWYNVLEWSPDSTRILVFYQWTDPDGARRNGTFICRSSDGRITEIRPNDKNVEGVYLVERKPADFSW